MSYSSEVKANMLKRIEKHEVEALVCAFQYFSNNLTFSTTSSKLARFAKENMPSASYTIKKGVKKNSHLYDVVFDEFACGELDKKELIRAAFLVHGSISNPEKGYNLEFVLHSDKKADFLLNTLQEFDFSFHRTTRNNKVVIYTKNSETIIYFLYFIGENVKAGDIENIRILRGIKSKVRRTMNFEIHNEELRLSAADKQIQMIEVISKTIGLSNIDSSLAEIAVLRLDNPDKSLSELAKLCHPELTKSGVNSRLKRIEKLYHSIEGK